MRPHEQLARGALDPNPLQGLRPRIPAPRHCPAAGAPGNELPPRSCSQKGHPQAEKQDRVERGCAGGCRAGRGSGVGVAFLPVPQEAGSRPLGTQHAWSSGGDACGLPCAVLGCSLEGPIPRGTATSAPGSRQPGWRSSCWQRDVRRGVRPLCTCARRWGGDSQWSSGEGLRFRRGEERRRECGVIRAKVTCEPWDGARGVASGGAAGTGVSFRSWGRSMPRRSQRGARSQGRARPQRGAVTWASAPGRAGQAGAGVAGLALPAAGRDLLAALLPH